MHHSTHPSAQLPGPRPLAGGSAALLATLVLVGGALNGLAPQLIERVALGDWPWSAISPIELFAMIVGAMLLRDADAPGIDLSIPAFAAAAALLVPSASSSWVVVAAFALWCLQFGGGSQSWRRASLLFFALALLALWNAVALRLIIVPIATMEATLTAAMLRLVRPDVVTAGNLVSVGSGHAIVVLAACSAAEAVPRVLLGVVSVAWFLRGENARRVLQALAIAALATVAMVETRLVLMAWSAEAYELVHGPIGANVLDAMQVAMALALGVWGARK